MFNLLRVQSESGSGEYCVRRIAADATDSCLGFVLREILAADPPCEFFSLSQTVDELTLIHEYNEKKNQRRMPAEHPPLYHLYMIHTNNPALDESGLLNAVSQMLAENNIPALFVSAYSYSYVLVPEERAPGLVFYRDPSV